MNNAATAAVDLVTGERQNDYGHPGDDFERQALIWTGILRKKLAPGCSIDARDIALCMIGVKLARESHKHKADNLVDIHGYANCLEMVVGEKAELGVPTQCRVVNSVPAACETCKHQVKYRGGTLRPRETCKDCEGTTNKPNWEARA